MDLERRPLTVRGGKGDQDRVTVLPRRLVDRLREQIERVRRLHEDDLALGFGRVWLPPALRRKYPNAEQKWDRGDRNDDDLLARHGRRDHGRADSVGFIGTGIVVFKRLVVARGVVSAGSGTGVSSADFGTIDSVADFGPRRACELLI